MYKPCRTSPATGAAPDPQCRPLHGDRGEGPDPVDPTLGALREFVDPRLEGLAASQKILLRIGPEHATRLKAWLRALRDAPTRAAPPR